MSWSQQRLMQMTDYDYTLEHQKVKKEERTERGKEAAKRDKGPRKPARRPLPTRKCDSGLDML